MGTGAFADVLNYEDATVVKLFRRIDLTHDPIEDPNDHDIVLRVVWDAECEAYELLSGHAEFAPFLPKHYGRLTVADVVGEDGQSIRAEYLLDCAYRLQRVPGRASKVHLLSGPVFTSVDAMLDRFHDLGIGHPYDASVFVPGASGDYTIIDIATWDATAELTDALATQGRLPESARKRRGGVQPSS